MLGIFDFCPNVHGLSTDLFSDLIPRHKIAPPHLFGGALRSAGLSTRFPVGFVSSRRVRQDNLRRLKELGYVARRVFAENLFASRPLHNIVSETYTIVREP